MATATYNVNDVIIVFFDQYRTLALFDKTKNKITGMHVLLDREHLTSKPQIYKLSISVNNLNIDDTDPTTIPDPTDPTTDWVICAFDVLKESGDTWQNGNEIVIGMGDIRNGFDPGTGYTTLKRFDLSDATVSIYVTSTTTGVLKFLQQ